MSLRIIALAVLLLIAAAAGSQDWKRDFETDCDPSLLCREFEDIVDNIVRHLEDEDGANAYRELKALEACDKCPEHRDNLDDLSDEIIRLFRAQNESLDSLLNEQQRIVRNLTRTTDALRAEREKVDRQLAINEAVTKDALVSNYMRLARDEYLTGTEIGYREARWLTDFAYHYVDSTHEEVQRMMYRLFYDQLLDYYDYDPLDVYAEDETAASWSVIATDWSPDEQWLAAGFDDGRLLIFDANAEVVFYEFVSNVPVTDVHWNRTGDRLAFVRNAGDVGFIALTPEGWRMTGGGLEVGSSLGTVRWSPRRDNLLAVATLGTTIYLFDAASGELIREFVEVHQDWVRDLAWSPDGDFLLSCDDQGKIAKWEVFTGKLVFERSEHSDYVRTVDWHPDGERFLSGGDDNLLILWNADGAVENILSFDNWIYQARYSASGRDIGVVVGETTFLRVTPDERIATPLDANVKRFAWRGEDNTVEESDNQVLGSAGADFLIPDRMDSGSVAPSAGGNPQLAAGNVRAPAWSPDGNYLAYLKDDKLEIITPDSILSFVLEVGTFSALAWHPGLSSVLPNTNLLATLTSDGELAIWDFASLSMLRSEQLPDNGLAVAWSPDGNYLAITDVAGTLTVYDAELNLVFSERLMNDFIRTVAWSPDGRRLLLGSDDNSMVLFDWRARGVEERFSRHTDWVRVVRWLDDRHFTSSADDGRTIIWNNLNREGRFQPAYEIGEELSGFHVSAAYQANAAGGMLAVGTTNGQIGRWRLDGDFAPTLDTLLVLDGEVAGLDWRPGSEALTFSRYGTLPGRYDRYLTPGVAYEGNNKPVESRSIKEVSLSGTGGLNNYFYLPKAQVADGRFDQIAWSLDERYFAYLAPADEEAGYTELSVHDLEAREPTFTYGSAGAGIDRLSFSPDGRWLAVAPVAGDVLLFAPDNPADSLRIDYAWRELMDWCWSDNGRYLVLLDRDHVVHRYDTREAELRKWPTGIEDHDRAGILAHPRRPERLYVLNRHGVYELMMDASGPARLVYENPTYQSDEIGATGARGTWIEQGDQLLYAAPGAAPVVLEFTARGVSERFTLGDPEKMFAWRGTPANRLYEVHAADEESVGYNAKILRNARVWDITTGEVVGFLNDISTQRVARVELSQDGRYLAGLGNVWIPLEGKYSLSEGRSVRIWHTDRQTNILDLPLAGTEHLAFSPRGNYLCTYFRDGTVGIWPLHLPRIADYLAATDKDGYLERLISKNNRPFVDRIDRWELEKGLDFRAGNRELLRQREGLQVRRGWGLHFVNEAFTSREQAEADANFERALALHYVPGTTEIRPSEEDTLALVNIWIERTYFALSKNDEVVAENALLNAQRLRPGLPRLAMLDLMLAWQEGRREGLVRALLDGNIVDLQEEYENWEYRDIHLREEAFILRLVALIQGKPDLVSPLAEPRMETLLRDLDPETRGELLVEYYRINAQNSQLIEPGPRQTYFEAALAFLESDWTATAASVTRLEDYISYNYYLQSLALENEKPRRAARYAANNRKAADLLLERAPRNADYQALYLAVLAEEARLDLQLKPTTAAAVRGKLADARERYPEVEAVYLELQLAKASSMLNEDALAYPIYYRQMEAYGAGGMQTLIVQELAEIDAELTRKTEAVFELYNDYRRYRDNYWNEIPFFTVAALEADTEDLSGVDWVAYERMSKAWFDATVALNKTGMLPQDSLIRHLEEYNRAVGDRIYLMLYSGNWELIEASLEDFREDLPLQQWPRAVDAVLAVLDGEWSTARKLIAQLKDLPNDGIRTEEFPTLRDFLLSLPAAVRDRAEFRKRLEDWRKRLGAG